MNTLPTLIERYNDVPAYRASATEIPIRAITIANRYLTFGGKAGHNRGYRAKVWTGKKRKAP